MLNTSSQFFPLRQNLEVFIPMPLWDQTLLTSASMGQLKVNPAIEAPKKKKARPNLPENPEQQSHPAFAKP